MTSEGMVYLATPYSHPDPLIREMRYLYASCLVAGLLREGHAAFSPIVYLHPVAVHFGLPRASGWYRTHNFRWIDASSEVWFAQLAGHESSTGYKEELDYCNETDKRFHILAEADLQPYLTLGSP